jgi:hypothetical protein
LLAHEMNRVIPAHQISDAAFLSIAWRISSLG